MMADEELGDEVKVFRRDEDADEDPMTSGETSEQQLADDKKEAVIEAELDSARRDPLIDGLKTEQFAKAAASPSFPMLPGLIPGASFSPQFPMPMFVPVMMQPNPYGLHSPNLMFPMGALSPSFGMFPSSPLYGAYAAALAKQQLENMVPLHMRTGPSNPLNQMRMPPYMPPGMMPQSNNLQANGGGKVKKEDHIKKPCNAFMCYMKANRKALLEEGDNNQKQSAELNKELGKRWTGLSDEEKQKYFEMARKEKELHKEKYPEWSARENYAVSKKKTTKRRDKSISSENSDQKKCRARLGVNNTQMWCINCQRKKKCLYSVASDMTDNQDGRATSGACSSSSESPSPKPIAGINLSAQHQQVALMHSMLLQMQLRSPCVPSPLTASSTGRSTRDTNASDSESDVDEDEDIDPTIMQQTQDVIMQESLCTL